MEDTPREITDAESAEALAAQESMYVSALYDPSRWYARARALFGASRAIAERSKTLVLPHEDHELSSVYRMVAGMALEALLKALLIAKFQEEDRTLQFPDRLRTHDLRVLAERLKIRLSDDERFCVENLTEHIVWTGRYPVPLRHEDHFSFSLGNEEEIVERLFRRLSKPLDLTS